MAVSAISRLQENETDLHFQPTPPMTLVARIADDDGSFHNKNTIIAILCIIVWSVVTFLLLIIGIYCLIRRRKKNTPAHSVKKLGSQIEITNARGLKMEALSSEGVWQWEGCKKGWKSKGVFMGENPFEERFYNVILDDGVEQMQIEEPVQRRERKWWRFWR
jgi:hypothetical protein